MLGLGSVREAGFLGGRGRYRGANIRRANVLHSSRYMNGRKLEPTLDMIGLIHARRWQKECATSWLG